MAGASTKMPTDTAMLDYLQRRGCIEIECTIYNEYSIGDQIEEGQTFLSLREAIAAEMRSR